MSSISKPTPNKYQQLRERLRILILQHRSEEMDYDEKFLRELLSISQQMLLLKKKLGTTEPLQKIILPFEEQKTRRLEHYI